MRILMAASFNYPHAGGLSTHMSMLARALTQASHEVDIASFSDLPAYLRLLGVQGPSFLLNRWRRGLGMVVSHRARRRLLAGVIQRRLPADVINAQDVFAALAARKAASTASAPVVLTLHGYMAWEAVSKGSIAAGSPAEKFFLDIEDQAYREADRIITVDTRLANYVKDRVGRTEGVTVIPNFIDLDSFDPLRLREAQARQAGQGWREKLRKRYGLPPNAYILFCPRRLTEKNGVIYPLLALPSLLALHPDYFLVYAGEGEGRQRLEEAIKRDRLSDHVRLLGALGRDAIEELYAASDLVLVPSVTSAGVEEATSIAALEGMAAGLPVVASSIGGLKELIQPEKTGWLVPQRDVAALSRAINTLREQPALAASIGQAARRYVEAHHSSQAAAQRFLEVYQSAIEDRRSQGQGGLGLVAHLQASAPEIPSASAPAQFAAPPVAPALAPPAAAPAPAPFPVPASAPAPGPGLPASGSPVPPAPSAGLTQPGSLSGGQVRRSRPLRLVISGFYGAHHAGDEAILSAMLRHLREEVPGAEVTVLSIRPEETAQAYGVKSIYRGWRRDLWAKIRALRQADLLISGGGGLLQDVHPTGIISGPLPYYLIICALAWILGTPFMFYAHGIGPITSAYGRWLTRLVANRAVLISVRDPDSRRLLDELGVNRPPVTITADPALDPTLAPRERVAELLRAYGLASPWVVFCLRSWPGPPGYQETIAQAADHAASAWGARVAFLPLENSPDRQAAEDIISRMRERQAATIIKEGHRPSEYAALVGKADLVVSMRLHGLIFAAAQGVPAVALAYDPKVKAFMGRLHLRPYCLGLEDLKPSDANPLVEAMEKAWANRQEIKEDLSQRIPPLKELARENARLVARLLQVGSLGEVNPAGGAKALPKKRLMDRWL